MNSTYSRGLRWVLALWVAALPAWCQTTPTTTINLGSQGRNADFSSFQFTRPITTGTVLPVSCVVGQLFFNTAAPAGSNLYGCTAANIWSLQGGAGTSISVGSPAISLSPASLAFGTTTEGTSSSSESITVSNTGTASLSVSGVTLGGTNSGDYSQTNNCSSVAAGSSCTISVVFTPSTAGSESALVSIADNAAASPQTAGLSGTGAAVNGGLLVTQSASAATINGMVTLTANRPVTFALQTGAVGTLTTVDATHATYTAPSSIPVQTSVGGCPTGPNDSILNTPITNASVDSRSSTWLAPVANYAIGPDPAYWINVVTDANPSMFARKFYYLQPGGQYPYYTRMFEREGGQMHNSGDSDDHHTISVLVNNDGVAGNCQWYETYNDLVPQTAGLTESCEDGTSGCNAQSGIAYSPASYATFQSGSTNAAGTTVNLVTRLDEIKGNRIHHPMTFTLGKGFVNGTMFEWPATSANGWAGSTAIPDGARLRLKSSFVIGSNYSQYAQAILNAWKNYGLILLDNGAEATPTFATDVYEDQAVAAALPEAAAGITLGNFEAVDVDDLKINNTTTEVNPANTEGVTPVAFAYVNATDAAPVNGTKYTAGTGIALQGVAIGVPHPQITMLAAATSYTYQLPFWVTGTSNQNVTWTLTSGPGSVTTGGLYTVPTKSTITGPTAVLLTGTSAADSTATVAQYINLLPFSSDGNFRMVMDKSSQADNSSPNPYTWWAATGLQSAELNFTGHDYPSWTSVAGPEQQIRQFSAVSENSSDFHLKFVLPNGNYKTRLLYAKECQNYCSPSAQNPANTHSFLPSWHAPEFINVNGQMDSSNYQWGEMIGYKYSTAWDYYAPAQVSNNSLELWTGGIVPRGTNSNPGPSISGIEIEPDTSSPSIAIDTGVEAWDYVSGANTTQPLTVAAGATQQLGAVGWYMSNSVTWSVTGGGSITSTGLYTAPAATLDPQTVTVTATSTVDATKTATATLTIPGSGVAAITLTPATLTFASSYVGANSVAQTITVQNTGNATFKSSAITFTGANAADFSQTNNCSSVPASASCTVSVTLTPSIVGPESGSLSIAGNETGSPQTAALSGTGIQGTATGSLTPGSLTFPSTQDGNPSAALTLSLGDSGTGGLLSPVFTFTGTNAADFSQTNNCGSSVAPGASCTVSVTFTPSIIGSESATVSIADNSTNSPHTATLSGTGTVSSAAISLAPTSIAFPELPGDQSINSPVVISNTGTGTLVIGSVAFTGTNAGNFSQINNCSSLAAGASCTVLVVFHPSGALGAESAALSITDNATGSPHSVPITASGNYGGNFYLNPAQLSFTSQADGTPSSKNITFSNTSNGTLTLSSFSFSGANAADFAQTNNCGSSIAANGNCSITVTFTPSAVGVESALLTIVDSGGYASPTYIAVGGIGH